MCLTMLTRSQRRALSPGSATHRVQGGTGAALWRNDLRKLVFVAHLLLTTAIIAPAAAETYKMTTPIAPGVATPDEIETSIGKLDLHDGVPSAETTEAIYDNLDRSRALQAYLLGIPIVNQVAMRNALREYGPDNTTDVIWENLVDSKTVELTANDNTVYSFIST